MLNAEAFLDKSDTTEICMSRELNGYIYKGEDFKNFFPIICDLLSWLSNIKLCTSITKPSSVKQYELAGEYEFIIKVKFLVTHFLN